MQTDARMPPDIAKFGRRWLAVDQRCVAIPEKPDWRRLWSAIGVDGNQPDDTVVLKVSCGTRSEIRAGIDLHPSPPEKSCGRGRFHRTRGGTPSRPCSLRSKLSLGSDPVGRALENDDDLLTQREGRAKLRMIA